MKFYSIFLLCISIACIVSCNKDDDKQVETENYVQATITDDAGRIDYYGQEENGFLRVSNRENGDKTELIIACRDASTDVVITITLNDYQGAGVYEFTPDSDNYFVVRFTEREIPYYPLEGALNFEVTSSSDDRITGEFFGEITHYSNSNLKRIIQNGVFTVPRSNF